MTPHAPTIPAASAPRPGPASRLLIAGEVGIGNTPAASAVIAHICGLTAAGGRHIYHTGAKHQMRNHAGDEPVIQLSSPAGGYCCRAVPPCAKVVKSGARYGAKPGLMCQHGQPAHPSAGHACIVDALRQRISKKEPGSCGVWHWLLWIRLPV